MTNRHKAIPAAYVILKKNNQILLQKRDGTGYCDGQYGLPSGHVDAGEPAIDALVREAKEEINISINRDALKLVHVRDRNADDGHRIDFFFECTQWEGEPKNLEPHKCSELRWINEGEYPEEIIPYVKEVLTQASSGILYSEENW